MEGDAIFYLAGWKHQVVLRKEKELGKWRVIGRAFVPVQDIERVIQQKNGKNYSGPESSGPLKTSIYMLLLVFYQWNPRQVISGEVEIEDYAIDVKKKRLADLTLKAQDAAKRELNIERE
ncbi:uncharacterized protein EAE98_008151 [Botrytis deweyae]|uniref:JmjC domain-containing protein n=1 Tax=Botrytis deweyae TaxID=2478750 RepID=A0ABQ7IFT0_9HELO|nr:uncharacterized protein EAE98_008151 [Botrytis deweyae]KAF7922625.1 hypothetical protein EAE98_008151 [Botrytis deweyae]